MFVLAEVVSILQKMMTRSSEEKGKNDKEKKTQNHKNESNGDKAKGALELFEDHSEGRTSENKDQKSLN
mgnify:CR=1 FL=1